MASLWRFLVRPKPGPPTGSGSDEELLMSQNSGPPPILKASGLVCGSTSYDRESRETPEEWLLASEISRVNRSSVHESQASHSSQTASTEQSLPPWDHSRDTTITNSSLLKPSTGPSSPKLLSLTRLEQLTPSEATPKQAALMSTYGNEQDGPSDPHIWPGKRKNIGNLVAMRERNIGTRLKAYEARAILRQKREASYNLDARFLHELRTIVARSSDPSLSRLFELGEHLQQSRDDVNPTQDDYDTLEDELNREEYELQEAESQLYEVVVSAGAAPIADGFQTSPPQEGIEPHNHVLQVEGESPEFVHYSSIIGRIHMVQDELQELRRERMHLVEEERALAVVGLQLNEESTEFLRGFDDRHEELQENYASLKDELARTRQVLAASDPLLFAANQFDDQAIPESSDHLTGKQYFDMSLVLNSSDPDASPFSTSAPSPRDEIEAKQYPRGDPLLLPDNDISPMFPIGSQSERGTISTVTYINEWLLNRLRRSSLEVWRFKSAEELQALDLDQDQLLDFVVSWWSKDEKAGDFLQQEKTRAQSLSLTSKPGIGEPRQARSDSVLHSVDRLASFLQRKSIGLKRHRIISMSLRNNSNGPLQDTTLTVGSE